MAYTNFNFGSSNGGGSTAKYSSGTWGGMPAVSSPVMPDMGMPDPSFMGIGGGFGSSPSIMPDTGVMSSMMMGDNAGLLDMQNWGQINPNGANAAFTPTMSQRLFGYSDPNTKSYVGGMAPALANAGIGVLQAGIGLKQYGLAKDQFKESKKQFALNYGASKKAFNNEVDRQAERLYSYDPARYGDPEERAAKQRIA